MPSPWGNFLRPAKPAKVDRGPATSMPSRPTLASGPTGRLTSRKQLRYAPAPDHRERPHATGYVYKLVEPEGRNFSPKFRPRLPPAEMLRLGCSAGKQHHGLSARVPGALVQGRASPRLAVAIRRSTFSGLMRASPSQSGAPRAGSTFGRPPRLVRVVLPLLARAAHGG